MLRVQNLLLPHIYILRVSEKKAPQNGQQQTVRYNKP